MNPDNSAYEIQTRDNTIRIQQAQILALSAENKLLRGLVGPQVLELVDANRVLSAKLRAAEKQISDYSWKANPDRMGS